MNVFFLGNGWLGWQVLRWLVSEGVNVVGLAVHPVGRRRFGEEILADAPVPTTAVFDASRLRDPSVLAEVASLKADIGVSVLCGYILKPAFLELFPRSCINLHTSLLPFNRGAHPNVWCLVDGTPAGVTLHEVDSRVDTGAILAQRRIEIEPVDTAQSLYAKLEIAGLELFQESWLPFVEGRLEPQSQGQVAGTFHKVGDLEKLDLIDLDAPTTARRVIDHLRARTFPPHPSACFVDRGRKVYVRVELNYGEKVGE